MMDKLKKTELWVALFGMLAVFLAPKIGVSEDSMTEVISGIVATVVAYIGGRSWAKGKSAEQLEE